MRVIYLVGLLCIAEYAKEVFDQVYFLFYEYFIVNVINHNLRCYLNCYLVTYILYANDILLSATSSVLQEKLHDIYLTAKISCFISMLISRPVLLRSKRM